MRGGLKIRTVTYDGRVGLETVPRLCLCWVNWNLSGWLPTRPTIRTRSRTIWNRHAFKPSSPVASWSTRRDQSSRVGHQAGS